MDQPQVVIKTARPTFKQKVSSIVQQIKRKLAPKKAKFDPVDEASEESFPASDPPAWSVRPPH